MEKIIVPLMILLISLLLFGCTQTKPVDAHTKDFCNTVDDCARTSLHVIENNTCEICCDVIAVNKTYAKVLEENYSKVCPLGSQLMCNCQIDTRHLVCRENKCLLTHNN